MLLLEIVLAFALVALCILPMVTPHIGLLRSQQKMLAFIQLDHSVNLLYGELLERLYTHEITWEQLLNEKHYAIDYSHLQKLGYQGADPKGFYFFKKEKQKPVNAEGISLYQIKVIFQFVPVGEESKPPLQYTYLLCVAHFAPSSEEQLVQNQEADTNKQKKKKGKQDAPLASEMRRYED